MPLLFELPSNQNPVLAALPCAVRAQAQVNSRGFGILDLKFAAAAGAGSDSLLGYACGGSGSLFKTGGWAATAVGAAVSLQPPASSCLGHLRIRPSPASH